MNMQLTHWTANTDAAGILWVTFNRNDSSANSLNAQSLEELEKLTLAIDQASNTLEMVVFQSGKKNGFILGADVTQFQSLDSIEAAKNFIQKGQMVFNKVSALKVPTVALIEGFCLGGGLEFALACKYRVAEDSPKTKLGLPEVKLGIHPGWHGTPALLEKVGAFKGLDMILTGRMVSAKEAYKMGFVDICTPKRHLIRAVLSLNNPEQKVSQPRSAWTHQAWARPLIGALIHRQLKQKANPNHYPAPYAVLNNWVKEGVKRPEASIIELQSISQLITGKTAQHLLEVFFLQEKLKNQGKSATTPKAQHVHVIGAGVMGGDIAAVCALRGLKVTLQDKSPALIAKAYGRAYTLAKKRLKVTHEVNAMMDRFIPDVDGLGIAKADVIIEAISENLAAKQSVFAMIEAKAKAGAILATNTSTIPLEEIAQSLKQPDRLLGIHFFNPVPQLPLVEVVYGVNTSSAALESACQFVRQIDKLPLKVKSAPGFLVNRILMPYMLEAVLLLEEGKEPLYIDQVMEDFGMPMGPIQLADTVGLDICLAALEKLAPLFNATVPQVLKDKVAAGDLGAKSGRGFYTYKKGKRQEQKKFSLQNTSDICDRLIFRMAQEALNCLEDGIVSTQWEVDAASIFGFGFAPFRGGLMRYLQEQGHSALQAKFAELESRHGSRFAIKTKHLEFEGV